MQNTIFLVNDEPFCLWDFELKERSDEFLRGLDAEYFDYNLRAHLNTDDEKRSSVALRLSLYHGLETLFSLMGAYVQAPDCAYAWLAKCSNSELRQFVSRVGRMDSSLFTKLNISSMSWESIAQTVFAAYKPDSPRQKETIKLFAGAWAKLAQRFLDKNFIDEYNSLKHGFRTRSGGFSLAFGLESSHGVAPPDEEMKLLGHSTFGASFFKIESIGNNKKNRSVRARRTAVNWSPEQDILALQLVYMSINNIIIRAQNCERAAGDRE